MSQVTALRTGKPLGLSQPVPSYRSGVHFGAAGSLLIRSTGGPGYRREVLPNRRPVGDLVALAELYSGERVDPAVGRTPSPQTGF